MEIIILLIVLCTSIWVLVDAKKIGVKKGQMKGMADMGPWGWFFACLLLWIIGFLRNDNYTYPLTTITLTHFFDKKILPRLLNFRTSGPL